MVADEQQRRRRVFVAGGTGYLGGVVLPELLRAGHHVRALVRPGSERKLVPGCETVGGNPLDAASYASRVAPADTFLHLVGVSHPAPWKARQFREIDLASVRAAVPAALRAGVAHFVYVSVAHPAPVMQAYWRTRAECEELIRDSGLVSTILRPWYVLGPGHRWPIALQPFYALAERVPSWSAGARRLGLVRLAEMRRAIVAAVTHPPVERCRVLEVEQIRATADRNKKEEEESA